MWGLVKDNLYGLYGTVLTEPVFDKPALFVSIQVKIILLWNAIEIKG